MNIDLEVELPYALFFRFLSECWSNNHECRCFLSDEYNKQIFSLRDYIHIIFTLWLQIWRLNPTILTFYKNT